MKRKITDRLVKWRNTAASRLPLLLYGARQVGKTYVMQELGADYFKNTVYVNFEADRKIGDFFENEIHAEAVLGILERYYHTRIIPDETLIIFDEIQKPVRCGIEAGAVLLPCGQDSDGEYVSNGF